LTKKFIFIDYLRILAFSSVFAGHLFPGYMSALLPSYLTVLWAGGAFGVVLFFLISGYVVTLALFRETPRQFAIRRFFRIYPAFTVALLVSYLVLPPPPLNEFFGQLSLLGDFFRRHLP
jgi:peptidoglycan/LPS O-acetylase OafA/YrhL